MKRILKLLKVKLLGGRGTYIFCPYCGSPNTRFDQSETHVTDSGEHTEKYPISCAECGASGIITENWSRT